MNDKQKEEFRQTMITAWEHLNGKVAAMLNDDHDLKYATGYLNGMTEAKQLLVDLIVDLTNIQKTP